LSSVSQSISLTVLPKERLEDSARGELPPAGGSAVQCLALIGNPNAGKTTLFNRLTGLRAKTANFPGTTIECRRGRMGLGGQSVTVLDMPGLYGFDAGSTEEIVAAKAVRGELPKWPKPTVAVVVVDATRVGRQLYLVSQVLEMGVPTVVALNMMDVAERERRVLSPDALSAELGVPVVPISARTGRGITELLDRVGEQMKRPAAPPAVPASLVACTSCSGCPFANRHRWAADVESKAGVADDGRARLRSDALDRVAAHPVFGLLAFAMVTAGLFMATFWLATYPMDWIEQAFAWLGAQVAAVVPEGDFQSLLVDGLIGGVGGVLVFLPQICILFFFMSLLEDTGYLARAALVMDRLMAKVGLPGKAFLPMLTAHACAIPAIMSTRVIEDRRDRLLSILVIPLMTCSARLPVYAMIAALLFADRPLLGGLMFTGAYLLGILAVFVVTFVFRRTILPGKPTPLVLELPDYRMPSLRTALLTVYDRGGIFLRKAGTVILLISVVLWALTNYPKVDSGTVASVASAGDLALLAQLEPAAAAGDEAAAEQVDRLVSSYQAEYSAIGRLGRLVEPVFAPLGFDWQINVGVLSSFAAREVIVSTLAIVYGIGEDAAEDPKTLSQTLAAQEHADGTPVFTLATSMSLLVFFVLAMQCLPTQAVTRRETGSWKWAAFQLAYMTILAWTAAFVTYQVVSRLT
jgi:ferrous iron transport protein B